MNEFLPQGYKEPSESNYMSFLDGENTFRILGSATLGWEYWTEVFEDGEKKQRSHRVKTEAEIPMDEVVLNKFGNLAYTFFWIFPVYNFVDERLQLLQVTQKSIRDQMLGYIKNPKWGDPKEYSFVVTRLKESGKTKYSTIAEPKEPLDTEILKKYERMHIDMSAWMAGKDPFSSEKTEPTVVEE